MKEKRKPRKHGSTRPGLWASPSLTGSVVPQKILPNQQKNAVKQKVQRMMYNRQRKV